MSANDLGYAAIGAGIIIMPLVVAIRRARRSGWRKGIHFLLAWWIPAAMIVAALCWKGHSLREHHRRNENQADPGVSIRTDETRQEARNAEPILT